MSCNECGKWVSIDVTTDWYPEQTWWKITNSKTNKIIYTEYRRERNTLIQKSMCLKKGSYVFEIFDHDRIRCLDSYVDDNVYTDDYYDTCGGCKLVLNGKTLKEGGSFIGGEKTSFSVKKSKSKCTKENNPPTWQPDLRAALARSSQHAARSSSCSSQLAARSSQLAARSTQLAARR